MRINGQQLADAAVAKRPDTEKYGPDAPPQILYKDEMCDKFVRSSYERAGGGKMTRWAGSNDMYRNALSCMYPLDMAKKQGILVPGAVLFIVKPGYNPKYKDDLGDAEHIGILTLSPHAEVMHSSASRGGVYPSTLKNAWTHAGLLKEVSYGADKVVEIPKELDTDYEGRGGDLSVEKTLHQVFLPSGSTGETVNFRKNSQGEGVVYARIPVGTNVLAGPEFTKNGQRWKQVLYDGMLGYMVSMYLKEIAEGETVYEGGSVPGSTSEYPYFPVEKPVEDKDYHPESLLREIEKMQRQIDYILQETGIRKLEG